MKKETITTKVLKKMKTTKTKYIPSKIDKYFKNTCLFYHNTK